ncbi:MAG: hypothetical protein WAM11_13365 [Cyanobium sp.]
MDENHPVLTALKLKLDALRRLYQIDPNEQSRYQLVRMERLIAEWAPASMVPV